MVKLDVAISLLYGEKFDDHTTIGAIMLRQAGTANYAETGDPISGDVPDRRRRIIPEVVLVRRGVIGVLGIWRGEGLGKGWDRGGQFTSNLRPRWTDPVTARRVPSK
jgi:hypothetical protein